MGIYLDPCGLFPFGGIMGADGGGIFASFGNRSRLDRDLAAALNEIRADLEAAGGDLAAALGRDRQGRRLARVVFRSWGFVFSRN